MKNNSIKYTVLALASLIASVSCQRELDPHGYGNYGDITGIIITPTVDGLPVKTTTEAGDGTYNEDLISNYCWFIFSDAAGTTPLRCGMETGSSPKTLVLDSVLPSGGTAYVYVIANLPEPYTLDAEQGIVNSSTSAVVGKTLSALEALEFDSAFYNFTSATTGLPAPANFVMRTEAPVAFTLEASSTVEVTASLKRVAAKIVLDLKVAKEVKQMQTNAAGAEIYKKTWQADIQHIQVYMLWGSTHGLIDGTKLDYKTAANPSDWFYSASPRYAMYTNPDGGSYDAATNTVSGSVPSSRYTEQDIDVVSSTWEQVYQINQDGSGNPIWIWSASTAEENKTASNIGDKTYGDWDYTLDGEGHKIPVVDAEGNFQYTLGEKTERKPYYIISSLPMYSMPITWNVNDAHAPFIKVILPWQGGTRNEDGDGSTFTPDAKTTEFYYKILVPERTSLDANGCYHISVDLSVLGSEADEVPVELYSTYHVVDWNATAETVGGVESAGRYLDCNTYFEFYSQSEMTIPVSSSHDITIVSTGANAPSATYTDYSSTASTLPRNSLTYSTTNSTGNYYKITPESNSNVTISHTQEAMLSNMSNRDIARITYTFRVQHADNATYYKDITVVQYPSLYIQSYLNSNYEDGSSSYNSNKGYVFINGQSSPSMGSSSNTATDWYYWTGLTSYSYSTGNNNPHMYLITTKVVDSSLGYVVGDPRKSTVSIPTDANSYVSFTSAPDIESNSRSLTYYYPTENTSQTVSMISPSFKIASSYGKCGYGFGYDYAVARCAAYQEDGYPAGRWRVPTKAEFEYITTLSANSLIPPLFNTVEYACDNGLGYKYWSANGMIKAKDSGEATLIGEDEEYTIDTNSSNFSSGSFSKTYPEFSIEFTGYSSIDTEYVGYSATTGTLSISGEEANFTISKIVVYWYSNESYRYDPDNVTISSGGGSVSDSSASGIYSSTWTGSSSSVTLSLSSNYTYRATKIEITASQTPGNYAFVRCVYDDWYWGSERPLGEGATTFTWGDKQR